MKNAATFFFLLWASLSFSQNYLIEIDSATGKFKTQDVLKFDSMSANDLYTHTQSFLPNAFEERKTSPGLVNKNQGEQKYLIKFAEKESNRIIVESGFYVKNLGEKVKFILTFDFKDNKVRYTFADYVYSAPGLSDVVFEGKFGGKDKIRVKTEEKIKAFIDSYIAHINAAKKDTGW